MTSYLVAPTEPAQLKELGKVTNVPETYGADVLWYDETIGGLVGVQRKEIIDFVASVQDTRLAKEAGQLTNVAKAFLIIEGQPHWSSDGVLMHRYAKWTRAQHRSMLRSIQERGITVETSDSIYDTIRVIQEITTWVAKGEHHALDRRGRAKATAWGEMNDEQWTLHMLQSVPGIGPKQAKAIYTHFEGDLPLGWKVPTSELLTIPGLGPKKVAALTRAFKECIDSPVAV